MGKHAAPEGAPADPIVAEALAHRSPDAPHHTVGEGPVGWPGEPAPEDGRVGWPGDLREPAAPAPTARRGWRRLFSAGRVA
ncbi:hypothetical protein [Blastococcus tunisiensis]|uniref:hypothetical protein n=1 Tax=Blastococcus tunisiensis TaxID=1798228 RepID=UPI0011146878|nr:hypothetical protein [Blastococcus sp. DSM 46838]